MDHCLTTCSPVGVTMPSGMSSANIGSANKYPASFVSCPNKILSRKCSSGSSSYTKSLKPNLKMFLSSLSILFWGAYAFNGITTVYALHTARGDFNSISKRFDELGSRIYNAVDPKTDFDQLPGFEATGLRKNVNVDNETVPGWFPDRQNAKPSAPPLPEELHDQYYKNYGLRPRFPTSGPPLDSDGPGRFSDDNKPKEQPPKGLDETDGGFGKKDNGRPLLNKLLEKQKQYTAAELVNGVGKNIVDDGLDVADLHVDEDTKLSSLTLNVDQEWLRRENAVKAIEEQLPRGTGFRFNKTKHAMEPVVHDPTKMGGIIQTVLDKESEIKSRYKQRVLIEHDLRIFVNRETASVVSLLTSKDMVTLRSKHPLVFSRLIEPLKSVAALAMLSSKERKMADSYNKVWYLRANREDKFKLVDAVRKDVGDPYLYLPEFKIPKKHSRSQAYIYEKLMAYHVDRVCQVIVRGNHFADKVFKQYDEGNGLYIAPYYTDIVPTLASRWLNVKFDRYYQQVDINKMDVLSQHMPALVGRFLLMVENKSVLVTCPEIQTAINSLLTILSRIMDGRTEPTLFLGPYGYYGFMKMCDLNCARRIINYQKTGADAANRLIRNKQREIIKLILMYLKEDLLKIDTAIHAVLVQLLYRTTKDVKYKPGNKTSEIRIETEYVKPKGGTDNAQASLGEGKGKNLVEKGRSFLDRPTSKENGSIYDDSASLLQTTRSSSNFFNRYLSGYRVMGSKVNSRGSSRDIGPYNVFKTPNRVTASLDNGMENMLEVLCDVINLDADENGSNLYYKTINAWVQVQGYHEAIHGFESKRSRQNTKSLTLGTLFRFLNMNLQSHLPQIPRLYLPAVSLVMQLLFFLQNQVEGYQRSLLNNVSNVFKGRLKLRILFKSGPKNYNDLYRYLEPHVIYNRQKYGSSMQVVGALAAEFKELFLAKPAIPAPIVQLISTFVALWVKGKSKTLDMASVDIDRVKKLFLLNYMSTSSGLVDNAAKIILSHCLPRGKRLHLGCIKQGGRGQKCVPYIVGMKKKELVERLRLLDAISDDPMDIIRIASDTARRCIAQRNHGQVKRQKVNFSIANVKKIGLKNMLKNKGEVAHASDRLFLHSEFAHRMHCYKLQEKMVKGMLNMLYKTTTEEQVKENIDKIFAQYQLLEISMPGVHERGHLLVCPFMESAASEQRDRIRGRIVRYVMSKYGVGRKLVASTYHLIQNIGGVPFYPLRLANTGLLPDAAGCVFVGTRKYDGIMFHGGFAPLDRIQYPENAQLQPNEGRLVYNGSEFVAELAALHETAGVVAISSTQFSGGIKRIYQVIGGFELDELDFGLQASNFVVRAHVLVTADALGELGYDIGKLIWCGYEHGWVVDFALYDVLGITDVPVYNGRYWLLSKLLTVRDLVGGDQNVTQALGQDVISKPIGEVLATVKDSFGKILGLPNGEKAGATSGVNTLLFDSGLGIMTPGAIGNLVKNASFDPQNNALVINLEASDKELDDSLFIRKNVEIPNLSFPDYD